jgi:hypothetical protein
MKQHTAEPHRSTESQSSGSPGTHQSNERDKQQIRERAFEIHLAHGDSQRSPELDWLEAEQQIRLLNASPQPKPQS